MRKQFIIMNKKLFLFPLMATLLLSLSLSVTSCKDDDDDDSTKSEERNDDANPLDTDEAQMAWRWLCALTNAQSLDDDWSSKSYEPTVGVASENNKNTRIVIVNSLDDAKAQFADLADVETDKLGSEYSLSKSGVGSMTWTPSPTGAQNLAEVSVDTKLIPTLQKIVYCTEEQTGQNGLLWTNVDGTAYYRFGDVIQDEATGAYWLCVRPAFKQGDKGDSHWICIYNAQAGNPIPEGNLNKDWNKKPKYNNKTIILPTKLKYKREHLNNLANFLFALLDPEAYATQVGTEGKKNGLGGFDYKYHGINFLTNVSLFWDEKYVGEKTIWELLFNRTHQDMTEMNSLALIYNGYHWTIGSTGSVHEFRAAKNAGFQRSAPGSESGDKSVYNFATEGYDVTRYSSNPDADNETAGQQQFVGGFYTWVVAYATGEQLMKHGKYSPYEIINGFRDIYNYNKKTGAEVHNTLEEEKTTTVINNQKDSWNKNSFEGQAHYHTGDVYKDENGHRWIVVRMAGDSYEQSPYSELISFEGLNATYNKAQFTNIPTLKEALRVLPPVWYLCKQSYMNVKTEKELREGETNVPTMLRNIFDYAGVDMRHLIQYVQDFHGDRPSSLFSVPFKDENSQKQRLLRGIEESDNQNNDMTLWFWEHYPEKPSATEQFQKNFSDTHIYLQDVADQSLVQKWAEDAYARQPITIVEGDIKAGDPRLPRKYGDARANDVTNYIYDYAKWSTNNNPTDMWNEPVMSIRVAAVYDRGQEYATTTVDGHKLTQHHVLTLVEEDEDTSDPYTTCYSYMKTFWDNFIPQYASQETQQIKLDGKTIKLPTWKETWNR